ncbi:MAG: peptidoglycan-binding protein [Candidatus Omnitrophica bacterium]|nr:peptidoglycan-binding protein [Candidatus Omnitrophota bacterium]
MRIHLIISLFFISASLIGCAHTQSPTAVNRLQIQVAQLEQNLQEKDKSIAELQEKVQTLNSQLGEIESEPIEEYDYRKTSRRSESDSEGQDSIKIYRDDEILRVAASPRDVQQALKNAGYYNGKIDGKLGDQSKKAISQFQKDHNLDSDGVIGKKTWKELKTYLD